MWLLGLDDVLALVGLLARKMNRVLDETKIAVFVSPAVVAMSVIVGEALGGGRPDFVGCREPTGVDTTLQLLQPHAHALHGLRTLSALIGQAFVGMDDEDPHARFAGGNFLNLCLWRLRFLVGRDTAWAFDPRTGRALNIIEHLAAAAAIAADDITLTLLFQEREITARHHSARPSAHT